MDEMLQTRTYFQQLLVWKIRIINNVNSSKQKKVTEAARWRMKSSSEAVSACLRLFIVYTSSRFHE